jgi:hypothetical protein
MNDGWTHSTRITKSQLRKARPENVVRLARWLKIRNIDTMSHRQLIRILDWLFKRREKRERGMTLW